MQDHFEPGRFYRPQDDELRLFGTVGALAVQRCRGEGPPFYRVARKVVYRGSDLNQYLESRRVEPGRNGG